MASIDEGLALIAGRPVFRITACDIFDPAFMPLNAEIAAVLMARREVWLAHFAMCCCDLYLIRDSFLWPGYLGRRLFGHYRFLLLWRDDFLHWLLDFGLRLFRHLQFRIDLFLGIELLLILRDRIQRFLADEEHGCSHDSALCFIVQQVAEFAVHLVFTMHVLIAA